MNCNNCSLICYSSYNLCVRAFLRVHVDDRNAGYNEPNVDT